MRHRTHGLATSAVTILVAAALFAAWTSSARAQCGAGPRFFGSVGGGMTSVKARYLPNGAHDAGFEIGRFWSSSNSDEGNNWGFTDPTTGLKVLDPDKDPRAGAGRCASSLPTFGWWVESQTTKRGLDGAISVAACEASSCPAGDLTFLIEDFGPTGPPGSNDGAYFLALRTSRDPASSGGANREWDLARPTGAGDFPLLELPSVEITRAALSGSELILTIDLGRPGAGGGQADAGDSVHVDNGVTTLDSAVIASLDVVSHTGPVEPGRERFADCGGSPCWSPVASYAYTDGPIVSETISVDCGDFMTDVYLAVGLTFHGGGGTRDVASLLVGRSVLVCDLLLADPDAPIRPSARPRRNDTRSRPDRRRR